MKQAMSTLKTFSVKERAYHAYQARQNYLRVQRSNQHHLDELQREVERARAAMDQERAAKVEALAEVERLKKLLDARPDNSPDD
jgi:phage host-nuclease inhibitor protein Gam